MGNPDRAYRQGAATFFIEKRGARTFFKKKKGARSFLTYRNSRANTCFQRKVGVLKLFSGVQDFFVSQEFRFRFNIGQW